MSTENTLPVWREVQTLLCTVSAITSTENIRTQTAALHLRASVRGRSTSERDNSHDSSLLMLCRDNADTDGLPAAVVAASLVVFLFELADDLLLPTDC